MRRVVALDLPGGPGFVAALQRVWDAGDAAFVVDRRLPPPARDAVLAVVGPAAVVDDHGTHPRPGGGVPCADGDALVVATSGTSGRPKAVVLTHRAVEASARASSARLGVGPADHWLACLPLAHVGGLSVVCRALVTGARLTVLPGFDAAAVAAVAAGGDVTAVSLVATALQRVDPGWFRVVLLGGSAPPPVLPPQAVVTYGMTETGSGVVYDGRPLDGVEVDVDADGGIRVRGPMLLRCYRDAHPVTGGPEGGTAGHPGAGGTGGAVETDPLDADGWLATGDVGAVTAEGRLVVRGRRGDVIVTGGEKVWPDALEPVLAGVPGVAEVAVAGVPDPEWGHRVVAFVVSTADGPPSLDALRGAARDAMGPYAAPKQLVVCTALPRTALGKVRRAELAASVEPPPVH